MNDDDFAMPGHCWDLSPRTGARCLDEPRHEDDHSNWHRDERWPNKQSTKPAAQATD